MAAGYDWPELEGLIEFTKKYGVVEAARRLGIAPSTLRGHFNDQGLTAKDYGASKTLNDEALKEIRDLLG